MNHAGLIVILLTIAGVLGACERDEPIRTYQAPKEQMAPPPAPMPEVQAAATADEPTWTVPEGWVQDGPRAMRVATFRTSNDPTAAELVVTRFAKDGFGGMLANINRWRGMVALDAVDDEKNQPTENTTVGGADATVFDMTGPAKDGQPARRAIIVMAPVGDTVWFFRFIGPTTVVEQKKAGFDEFLKSVKFPN